MRTTCIKAQFHRRFSANLRELPGIKSDVLAVVRHHSWSEEDVDRFELVLEEAVVNIIRHAYPDHGGEIDIRLYSTAEGLLLRLEDNGIPFDPASAPVPDPEQSVQERPIGGLGIFLMRRMADEIEYRREGGGNTLDILMKQQSAKE